MHTVIGWLVVVGTAAGAGGPPGDRLGQEVPPDRSAMRRVPPAIGVLPAHHSEDEVLLAAFDVDVRPVTRRDYLVCVAHEGCPPVDGPWRDTRGPAELDGEQAQAYCRFAGKRLPARFEWPIAAQALGVPDSERLWTTRFGVPEPTAGEDGLALVRCVR